MRYAVLLLVAMLLAACSEAAPTADAFVVEDGDLRVRLEPTPFPPAVGEPMTLLFIIEDASTGQPIDDLTVRPVADLTMATSRMYLPLTPVEPLGDGQYRTTGTIERDGAIRVSATVVHEGIAYGFDFPEVPVAP